MYELINDNSISNYKISKTEMLLQIIHDKTEFKSLSQRYFEIFMVKEGLTKDELKQQYMDFFCSVIDEQFIDVHSVEDVVNLRNKLKSSTSRLKKRWAKMAMESLEKKTNKFLNKEYLELRNELIKKKEIISEKIKTPEDIIPLREATLKEWSCKVFKNVTDFIYLEDLSINKIKSAFSNDLTVCVIETLRFDYGYDINKIMINSPVGLAPGLFINYSRGKRKNYHKVSKFELGDIYKTDNYTTKNEDGNIIDVGYEFHPHNPSNELTSVGEFIYDLLDEKRGERVLPKIFLDQQDLAIIRLAYSNGNSDLSELNILDIIKFLGLADSSYNYKKIEEKCLKLPYYTFYTEKVNEEGHTSRRTYVLFTSVEVVEIKKGKKIVKITKAPKEMNKLNIELMYKNELKKLKSYKSVDIAFMLESTRISLIREGKNLSKIYYKFDIDFLRNYVYIDNKTSTKNKILELEPAFKEIKENQFIIKDYRVGDVYFEVLFYENTEKKQLLFNNSILSLPEYF